MISYHWMLFATAVLMALASYAVKSEKSYKLHSLTSPGVSSAFSVSSEVACIENCFARGSCSAVSYSSFLTQCVVSICSQVQLKPNALWDSLVFLPSALVESCDFPAPSFEWMLTDACGNYSYAVSNNVPAMQSLLPMEKVAAPSVSSGQAFSSLFTCWHTELSGAFNLNFSRPFSYFFYFNQLVAGNSPLIEVLSSDPKLYGVHVWMYSNGLYYNVGAYGVPILCDNNCANYPAYPFTPTLNTWNEVALVYDPTGPTATFYLNGSAVVSNNLGKALQLTASTPTWNQVTLGCRKNYQHILVGSIYCAKVFKSALTATQVRNVASSCIDGRIRVL